MERIGNLNRKTKQTVIIAGIALVLLIVIIALVLAMPKASTSKQVDNVTVTIESGSSASKICDILEENGVVKNGSKLYLYIRLHEGDMIFQAGTYNFDGNLSYSNIIDILSKGGITIGEMVTIPEGYTIEEIAAVLEKKEIISAEDFLKACVAYPADAYSDSKGYDLPEGDTAERLEGYLFPDTYAFNDDMTGEEIITTMIDEFNGQFDTKWWTALRESRYSLNEIVTLASIIEKEALYDKERPEMAGVFYNRLDAGMKLQSNVTVNYILKDSRENLTYEDIAIDSPYNTYMYQGLPPGAICCPGKESLKAALFPHDNDYLYFMGKSDGTHIFSKTYDEHLAAKKAVESGKE